MTDEERRERRKKKKSKERDEVAAIEAPPSSVAEPEAAPVKETSDVARAASTDAVSSEIPTEEMDEKERKRLEKKKRKAEREAAAKAAMEAELAALAEAEAELARLEAESAALKPAPTEASSESATDKCESQNKIGKSEVLPECPPLTLESPNHLSSPSSQSPLQMDSNEEIKPGLAAEINLSELEKISSLSFEEPQHKQEQPQIERKQSSSIFFTETFSEPPPSESKIEYEEPETITSPAVEIPVQFEEPAKNVGDSEEIRGGLVDVSSTNEDVLASLEFGGVSSGADTGENVVENVFEDVPQLG